MAKIVSFGSSDGGQNNLNKRFPGLKVRYELQVHVETIPVWIVCLHLENLSSEPGAPKWYFEKLYFEEAVLNGLFPWNTPLFPRLLSY
jgi:hypothetical protein